MFQKLKKRLGGLGEEEEGVGRRGVGDLFTETADLCRQKERLRHSSVLV
jgi:hypothetical protein